MTKPLPWSPTGLDAFVNCPYQFYRTRVVKDVKEDRSPQMIWGEQVHKAFELRMRDGKALPIDLIDHEPLMQSLAEKPGAQFAERKVALSTKGEVCGFFGDDVWMRCVIDYTKIRNTSALVVDYKTGKKHSKFKQLKVNALHIFHQYPEVQKVNVAYYWTTDLSLTGETYTRDQVPAMWNVFMPDLKQYRQAFAEDVWQKRPSGLCFGWCGVKDCDNWKPKKGRY